MHLSHATAVGIDARDEHYGFVSKKVRRAGYIRERSDVCWGWARISLYVRVPFTDVDTARAESLVSVR